MSDIGTATSGNVLTSQGLGKSAKFLAPSKYLSFSGTFTALAGRGYILTAAATITLPTSPANGTTISFIADTASNVVLTANAANVINIQNVISNYGGTATSAALGNAITLVYNSNATAWDALSVTGTWTLNTFSPASLASAPKIIWIDGADPLGTGTPPADGTNTLPVDKFSVLNLVQATSSKRPVFNTNVQNSLGSLRSNAANVTALTGSIALGASLSFIALITPSTAANAYVFGSNGSSNIPAIISDFGGLSYEWFNGADRYTISAGATGLNLLEVYQTDASTLVAYLNGTQVFSHVPTVAIAGRSMAAYFAATNTLNPSTLTMSEFIVYRANITAAQQLNIRRYIAQKWALSIVS